MGACYATVPKETLKSSTVFAKEIRQDVLETRFLNAIFENDNSTFIEVLNRS